MSKNVKLAMAPLLFMVILFLWQPGLSGSVGVLVPVGVLIAIGVARILYKRGLLDEKQALKSEEKEGEA